MIQDFIVVILIIAALSKMGYQLSQLVFAKKRNAPTCGGCSQCELKKSLIHHAD
jgi:hypothetical protein